MEFQLMPIWCSQTIRNTNTQTFGRLDYGVMRHVFDSHNKLGRLADESVYQADVSNSLATASMEAHREVDVLVKFETFEKKYWLDLLVGDWGVYEFKSVSNLLVEHRTQLLNYLRLLDISHGKLVNFRGTSVQSEFVNSDRSLSDRRNFYVEKRLYNGPLEFASLVEAIVRDWGTGLTLTLYRDAISWMCMQSNESCRLIPVHHDGQHLGNQRFMMASQNRAFRVTAFETPQQEFSEQLRKLISHTTLDAIEWINVALGRVTLQTIDRSIASIDCL